MTIKLPASGFCNLADSNIIYRDMKEIVLLLKEETKYTALLLVISCFIDSFTGDTTSGNNKENYKNFIETKFPELFDNNYLTPDIFYKEYRCDIAHGYSIGLGYAIVEDHEINGVYVDKFICDGKSYVGLNIDKFSDLFLSYLDKKYK